MVKEHRAIYAINEERRTIGIGKGIIRTIYGS